MNCTFQYGFTTVGQLRASYERRRRAGKVNLTGIVIDGQEVAPTKRFWKSFFIRFGISDSVFRYFEPPEVFQRISERFPDDTIRYCIERGQGDQRRLLAVSNPTRSVIRHGEVVQLVSQYGGRDHAYADGVVTSTHIPRSGEQPFRIGGDQFQHRFVLETPVDGFGHPRVYLSVLRLVCSNGMVGYGRAFRSDISLGKDISHCIGRALETYDNGEGYAALRQRFESAQSSWASVRESLQLYKCLIKVRDRQDLKTETAVRDLNRLTGNLNEIYGLANMDALSPKRQRILPTRCRVYDLLNFASEIATHHSNALGARSMQAFIGGLIADEYDMEGTAEAVTEFSDFFVQGDGLDPAVSLN
jgi:hypothetical protein